MPRTETQTEEKTALPRPSDRAMACAVEMEIHAACGTMTIAKARDIDKAFPGYDAAIAALEEAKKLGKIAETLTGCRSDDEYVWGIQARIDAALLLTSGEAA